MKPEIKTYNQLCKLKIIGACSVDEAQEIAQAQRDADCKWFVSWLVQEGNEHTVNTVLGDAFYRVYMHWLSLQELEK
jgi:hypothetical protein